MEPSAKQVVSDVAAPKTDYEKRMFDAMDHALQHLLKGYQTCEQCGLVSSEAQSRGVLLALNKLLGVHLAKHLACMLSVGSGSSLDLELDCITTNLRAEFEKKHPMLLAEILKEQSQTETKQ